MRPDLSSQSPAILSRLVWCQFSGAHSIHPWSYRISSLATVGLWAYSSSESASLPLECTPLTGSPSLTKFNLSHILGKHSVLKRQVYLIHPRTTDNTLIERERKLKSNLFLIKQGCKYWRHANYRTLYNGRCSMLVESQLLWRPKEGVKGAGAAQQDLISEIHFFQNLP